MLYIIWVGFFFYPMMKLVVQVSKEGTSATHRWAPFPESFFCIIQYWKLVKKQSKTVGTYRMQLSTVDSSFFKNNPSNLYREASPATLAIIGVLKVFNYDLVPFKWPFYTLWVYFLKVHQTPKSLFLNLCIKIPNARQEIKSSKSKKRRTLVVMIPGIRGLHMAFLDTLKPIPKAPRRNTKIFFLTISSIVL